MKINKVLVKRSEEVFRHFFSEIPIKAKSFTAFWRKDKTASASFFKSDTGNWVLHDFASGQSYDIFEALKTFKGYDFKGAIEAIGTVFPSFAERRDDKNYQEWASRRAIPETSLKIEENKIEYEYFDYFKETKIGSKYRLFNDEEAFTCDKGLSTTKYFFWVKKRQGKRLYILGSEGDCISTTVNTGLKCIAIPGESPKIPSQLAQMIEQERIEEIVVCYDNPEIEEDAGNKTEKLAKELIKLNTVNIVYTVDWSGFWEKDAAQVIANNKHDLFFNKFKRLEFKPVDDDIEVLKERIESIRALATSKLDLHSVLDSRIANFLVELSKSIDNNFPPEAVFTQFLTLIAGLIGTSCELQNLTKTSKHAVLWSCVALPVGAGKSDALKYLLKPLVGKEIEYDKHYKQELESYNLEQKQQRKKDELFKPRRMPICKHILLEDTTIEAVRKVYCNNQVGIIVAYDELAKFFQSHGQYKAQGGDDRASYLSLASGAALNLTRVEESNNIRTSKSAVNVTGGIQPNILKKIYKEDKQRYDGLWDRFLYYFQPNYEISETENTFSRPNLSFLYKLYDWFFKLRNISIDDPYVFCLEDNDILKAVSLILKCEINEAEGQMKAYLSKQYSQFLNITLILHLLHCAINEEFSLSIQRERAIEALEVLEFFKKNANNFFQLCSDDSKINLYTKILDLDDLTARSLCQKRLVKNKKEAETIFLEMQKMGYGKLQRTDRGALYFERGINK